MIDSTNHKNEYLLQGDLKDNLSTQEKWDAYCKKIVGSNRKITKHTWDLVVFKEAQKNNIDLKIYRNGPDDTIHFFDIR